MLRSLFFSLAILGGTLPASAAIGSIDPAASALIRQARAHLEKGQIEPAIAILHNAIKADDKSSEARTLLAQVFYEMSKKDDSHQAEGYRRDADALALQALKIDRNDDDAADVRTRIAGTMEQKYYEPDLIVLDVTEDGNDLYERREFDAARKKYEDATRRDPRYADAYVSLANCYIALNDRASAEKALRQAIKIDPNLDVAWLGLATLLKRQSRFDDAARALMGALSARPNSYVTWHAILSEIKDGGGKPQRFNYDPKGSYSLKRKTMLVDGGQAPANQAAWSAFARAQKAELDNPGTRSPFALLLATWDRALADIDKLDKTAPVTDPTLHNMLVFKKAGQLKAALFALRFQEAYRDDFEAWKKAEPDALKRFVVDFQIGP